MELFMTVVQSVLRTQYRKYSRKVSARLSNPAISLRKPQPFDYFLIVDFEATCDRKVDMHDKQEIIEFPVLKMNSKTLRIESKFHSYVKPQINPELSSFCIGLTGIVQQTVDESDTFPVVLQKYLEWHRSEVGDASYLPVTVGDWDLKIMLPRQCQHNALAVPHCFSYWHNVKLSYCAATNSYCKSFNGILRGLEVERVGAPHRGLDDCYTLAKVLRELIRRGLVIVPTAQIDVR